MRKTKTVKKQGFVNTLRHIAHSPKQFLAMGLLDLLFGLSLLLLYLFIKNVVLDRFVVFNLGYAQQILFLMLPVMIINYLIVMLFYSLFKLSILSTLRESFKLKRLRFKRLKEFGVLNFCFFIIVAILLKFGKTLAESIFKQSYVQPVSLGAFVVIGVIAYIFLNLTHSFFGEKTAVQAVEAAYEFILKNIWQTLKPAISLVLSGVVVYLIGYFVYSGIRTSYTVFAGWPQYSYMWTTSVLMFIFAVIVISFHRIWFYSMIAKN